MDYISFITFYTSPKKLLIRKPIRFKLCITYRVLKGATGNGWFIVTDTGRHLKRVDEELRAEILALRASMDMLHLKHKEIAAEIGACRDLRAKDQSEVLRLTGDCALNECDACGHCHQFRTWNLVFGIWCMNEESTQQSQLPS